MAVKPGIYAASMSIFNEDLSLDIASTLIMQKNFLKKDAHGVVILVVRMPIATYFFI